jgi:hypothetical protein
MENPAGTSGGAVREQQDSRSAPSPQLSPDLQRLAYHVERRRHMQIDRIGALRCAYGALRRAHELGPSNELLDAALICLDHLAEARANLADLRLLERCAGLEGLA